DHRAFENTVARVQRKLAWTRRFVIIPEPCYVSILHLEMTGGFDVARVVAMRQVGIASALHRQPVSEKLQREQQRKWAQRLVLALDRDSDVDRLGQRRARPSVDAQALRANLAKRVGHLLCARAGGAAAARHDDHGVAIGRAYRAVQKFLDL